MYSTAAPEETNERHCIMLRACRLGAETPNSDRALFQTCKMEPSKRDCRAGGRGGGLLLCLVTISHPSLTIALHA
ncbi:hypothetical protein V8C44DRAFT_338553 [Trichoderma aethiopicum]